MYFKITNKKETHHGFKYQDGLNVLKGRFRKKGHCVPGGFYFSDKDNICSFLHFGIYIREIMLPEHDKEFRMVRDGDDKWRANKIILGKKMDLRKVKTWKYLISIGIKLTNNINTIVYFSSNHNRPKILRHLINVLDEIDLGHIMNKVAYLESKFIKKIFKKGITEDKLVTCMLMLCEYEPTLNTIDLLAFLESQFKISSQTLTHGSEQNNPNTTEANNNKNDNKNDNKNGNHGDDTQDNQKFLIQNHIPKLDSSPLNYHKDDNKKDDNKKDDNKKDDNDKDDNKVDSEDDNDKDDNKVDNDNTI